MGLIMLIFKKIEQIEHIEQQLLGMAYERIKQKKLFGNDSL